MCKRSKLNILGSKFVLRETNVCREFRFSLTMLDISAVLTFIFHFYSDIGVLFVILFGNPYLEEASSSLLGT